MSAHRHRIPQSRRRFQRCNADPGSTFTPIQLHALAGDLTQPRQHCGARGQQWIVDLPGQLDERGPEPPSALGIPGQQAMNLQPRGKPMRGGPRQPGAFAQFGQATGRLGNRVQQSHGFVQHADTAILSHKEILAFQIVR